MNYRRYSVQKGGKDGKQRMLDFIHRSLCESGCRILASSEANSAPFRITFEGPDSCKYGVIIYPFTANSKVTKNRPADEHRFQIKYGPKTGEVHQIWQDPFMLYTTLMVGIDLEREIFVGVDPLIHEWTKFFISVEFKRSEVEQINDKGWHFWERDKRGDDPVEVMVGGKPKRFFDFVRFEQAARGLAQGHRFLLAENLDNYSGNFQSDKGLFVGKNPPKALVHELAGEFEITEEDILNMIQAAPRLKMAVRGWVAEKHLGQLIQATPGIDQFKQLEEDGKPDFEVVYQNSSPILIECKNVLRIPLADGTTKVDFQKTRASKGDPCTRFYSSSDFQILAACLHARTENWEFSFCPTSVLKPHKNCEGKLSNLVRIDDSWSNDLEQILRGIAA